MVMVSYRRKSSLGIRRPFDAQNVVVVSSIGPMQDERRKFADKMIGRSPDLYVGTVGGGNEPEAMSKIVCIKA